MNLPNSLTALRVFLIPVFIFFFYQIPDISSLVAASVFLIASLTDILDGYFARRRSEITKLGKFLDPVADKLLILSALILLVGHHDGGHSRVPAWMAILIVGREVAVTGFRAVAASEGVIIAAEGVGKYKTFLQTISVILLVVDAPPSFHQVGLLLLFMSIVLALISARQYFVKFTERVRPLKSALSAQRDPPPTSPEKKILKGDQLSLPFSERNGGGDGR